MFSDLVFRFRSIFWGNVVEEELDDELRFHVEQEVEKRMARGLPRSEALRQAKLFLGGLGQVKEECREARGISALETALQDIRYAMRGMRRNRVFTLVAVLTLGFGTGAVSTVFTIANTLFFRELPVAHPDRVIAVEATRRHGQSRGWVSYPDYLCFRDGTKTLEGLAAHYSTAPLFVTGKDRAQELNGAVVSANFFSLLGVSPALGRFFRQDEDSVPDRDRVAVLGYELWRNWFKSSTAAVGATLKINGSIFTVIGVAPETFRGMTIQPDEIYIPTMMARTGYRWCQDSLASDCTAFEMIGRLRAGYKVEQARAEMATLIPLSWKNAKEGENTGVTAFPAKGITHPDLTRSSELRFIEVLTLVAGVLLLVCCANLSGLLIARNSARTREFAIRASIGAGRFRLIQQLITESVLLAVAGGAAGLLFSLGLTAVLNTMFYSLDVEGHPLHYNFNPELPMIVAVLAVSIAAGCFAGVIPALKSIRSDAGAGLKRQASATGADSSAGRWLAGAQGGIAVALATIAGLLGSSAHFMMVGNHFEVSHVALMRLRPRLVQYPPEKAQRYLHAVLERLEANPGVEAASLVSRAVLVGGDAAVSLPGQAGREATECEFSEIGPRYFEVLRTRMLRGREFNEHDTMQSPPVAIVSETLARRFWRTGAAIGSTLMVNHQPRQVIGVVEDIPLGTRGEPSMPYVYVPFWQNAAQVDARLCIRVRGEPAEMLPALIREANRVDPNVPIAETIPLSVRIAGSVSDLRITASFASYAATLAVLLSALGLYGTLAFSVSRRTKEIGIRMAVGAKPAAVLGMMMREGMSVVLLGIALGFALAPAGSAAIRHLLYGSGADDAQVYAMAVALVAVMGLLACWVPARRAASVEPMIALREE